MRRLRANWPRRHENLTSRLRGRVRLSREAVEGLRYGQKETTNMTSNIRRAIRRPRSLAALLAVVVAVALAAGLAAIFGQENQPADFSHNVLHAPAPLAGPGFRSGPALHPGGLTG